MLRKSLMVDHVYLSLLSTDRHKCKWIAILVVLQCLFVYVGSFSIISCHWSPEKAHFENDKLARIMYLFDYEACGYVLSTVRSIANLNLSNETETLYGLLPIQNKPADVTVSARLSGKTRVYIKFSLIVHIIWMFIAILLRLVTKTSRNMKLLKYILLIFLLMNVFVIVFDMSMAIVYVAHIQKSLTKGMIVRYSGWSVDFHVKDPDEFAGWLPLVASCLWLRGILLFIWNLHSSKLIYYMRKKIKMCEVRRKLLTLTNLPIPEPDTIMGQRQSILHYRTGEFQPDALCLSSNSILESKQNY